MLSHLVYIIAINKAPQIFKLISAFDNDLQIIIEKLKKQCYKSLVNNHYFGTINGEQINIINTAIIMYSVELTIAMSFFFYV